MSAESEDFYYKLYESNVAKNLCLVAALIFTLTLLPALTGIILFENFGSDKKRTIINMMITSMCYANFQGKDISVFKQISLRNSAVFDKLSW